MAFSISWLWRKSAARSRLERLRVVLYTRAGCHLCATAWERLEEARRQYQFQLASIDVDHEPELAALYGEQVPVVAVDGKVRFRGAVNEVLLGRLLRAEADKIEGKEPRE
jgi:glutaredoxin